MSSHKMTYLRLCLLKSSSAIFKLFRLHHALVKKKRHENYKKGKHFVNNNNNNNNKKIFFGVFYICAMTSFL